MDNVNNEANEADFMTVQHWTVYLAEKTILLAKGYAAKYITAYGHTATRAHIWMQNYDTFQSFF